jgi:hypothetical protein
MQFVMHDLLYDLAKYVCGNFCLTLKVGDTQNISEITRYFFFIVDKLESSKGFEKGFEPLFLAKRLRTFLPLSMDSCQHSWSLRLPLEFFSNLELGDTQKLELGEVRVELLCLD